MERKVAVFVGSLRAASWSRKVARALIALAPHSLQPETVEIGQLPLYNQDFDDSGNPSAEWTAFRQQVKAYDASLFVTPSTTVPFQSHSRMRSMWDRVPTENAYGRESQAVVSVSPGATGALGANHYLPQSLVFPNVPCMKMPEAYIGDIAKRFDEKGALPG
jgi:chromate reductase